MEKLTQSYKTGHRQGIAVKQLSGCRLHDSIVASEMEHVLMLVI